MTPAGRVSQRCSVGEGEALPASDRERPGHERGMKVTAEPLSAIGRRAQSVAGS